MATRGGHHAGTPLDTQTVFIRNFLAFIGIADVNSSMPGPRLGDEPRSSQLSQALGTSRTPRFCLRLRELIMSVRTPRACHFLPFPFPMGGVRLRRSLG